MSKFFGAQPPRLPPLFQISSYAPDIETLTNLDLVIIGDFNQPEIDWSSLSGNSPSSNLFCDFVYKLNLVQLVNFPTHSKGNILDLILVSSPDLVSNVAGLKHSSISNSSDHIPISMTIPCSIAKSSSPNPSHPLFSKGDYVGMCSFLLDVDFSPFYASTDIESLWLSLKGVINESIINFVPHPHPKWFTATLRHSLNKLHTQRRKTRNSSEKNHRQLQIAESKFSQQVTEAKAEYETNLINQYATNKGSKVFDYIRSIKKSSNFPNTVVLNDVSASSDINKATLFNTFFRSVFKSSNIPFPNPDSLPDPKLKMDNIEITDLDVYSVLNSLDPNKATGPDGIPARLLKTCALALYQPIHHIFTQCLEQSYTPTEWRIHQITPIFKSGDRGSVTNYRPISLLCCISKVLEKIIHSKSSEFVTKSIIYHHLSLAF